jgi:hypothetical protein
MDTKASGAPPHPSKAKSRVAAAPPGRDAT